MKKNCCTDPSRLGKVGGQAVLEGVMMKAGTHTVTTCRTPDGDIVTTEAEFVSVRTKHTWLNIPLLRGVVNFIEMLILSFKTLGASAKAMGLDEEEDSKTTDTVMIVALILGIALALGLFLVLPAVLADLVNRLVGGTLGSWRAPLEGVFKIAIFLTYLWLVSLMPDIKRTFMYHGAEHKSIACYEAGAPLTPEVAKDYSRFHPRCGTSFMFFMILLGVIASFLLRELLPELPWYVYIPLRILILPLIMGIGYEFIMYAGKHNNLLVRILSAPGLWVQRITTREPTEDMLAIAIISLKCAMRDEDEEFRAFYEERPWEPKATDAQGDAATEDTADADDGQPTDTAAAAKNASAAEDPCVTRGEDADDRPLMPTASTEADEVP